MTEDLSSRELALLKLIDIQAKEITQLGMQVESLRYNKRFTNTKYTKEALKQPKIDPVWNEPKETKKK